MLEDLIFRLRSDTIHTLEFPGSLNIIQKNVLPGFIASDYISTLDRSWLPFFRTIAADPASVRIQFPAASQYPRPRSEPGMKNFIRSRNIAGSSGTHPVLITRARDDPGFSVGEHSRGEYLICPQGRFCKLGSFWQTDDSLGDFFGTIFFGILKKLRNSHETPAINFQRCM